MNLTLTSSKKKSLVTVVIPSFNQGVYLEKTLTSVFDQKTPVQVFVMDGGSSDNSIEIIKKWQHKLSHWRSCKDDGQSSAINEGIGLGDAPYVCWLNSDDWMLPNGLRTLLHVLENNPKTPVVYGKSWRFIEKTGKKTSTWVEPFNESRLAVRCIISQPATLIKRSAWEAVGGLDRNLHMALDYDLWWRIYREKGKFKFINKYIAVNRDHPKTKTNTQRAKHYYEAIKVVKRNYGYVPIKWVIAKPYAVWFKSMWPF
jgi:hypothetical protein